MYCSFSASNVSGKNTDTKSLPAYSYSLYCDPLVLNSSPQECAQKKGKGTACNQAPPATKVSEHHQLVVLPGRERDAAAVPHSSRPDI